MSVPLFLVDAFAAAPFAGNPAAVCLLDAPADPVWMQAVAAELQQPATAFVHPVQRAERSAPPHLVEALGVQPRAVLRGRLTPLSVLVPGARRTGLRR